MPNTINQYRLQSGHHNGWLQHHAHSVGHKHEGKQLLEHLSCASSVPIVLASGTPPSPPRLKFKHLAGGVIAGLLVGCAIGSVATVAFRRSPEEQFNAINKLPETSALYFAGNITTENSYGAAAAPDCPQPGNIVATQPVIESDNIPGMKYCSPSREECKWAGYDPFTHTSSTVNSSLNAAGKPTLNNGLVYCDYTLASGDQIRMALQEQA